MTLAPLFDATRDYLLARPDCRAFWSTVDAGPGPGTGRPDLAKIDCLCPLDTLPDVLRTASEATARLTREVVAHSDRIEWFQVYDTGDPVGKGKIDRTAVAMLCGNGAVYASKHGLCGFYYLKQGVEYAPHAHAPREIYAILSGTARYWNEATGWRTSGPGEVIHTPEWSWHAMTTVWEPVLILWAWIGDGLDRPPDLRDPDGALPNGAFDGIDRSWAGDA